jgi:hypothetical protein
MHSDRTGNDPKIIWQKQPTELTMMTIEKIHRKARELHQKTRRKLLGNGAAVLLVMALCGFGMARARHPVERTAFVLAIVWGLAGLYVINRGMWSATLPGDAASTSGLEFYRREIERRQNLFRRALQWSFGPVVLAIGAFVLSISGIPSRALIPNGIPFLALVAVWIAAVFVIRMKERRELQREIDELNAVGKETGS